MPALQDMVHFKSRFSMGKIFANLSLTQRVMTIIFFGILFVGITIAIMLENEHHKSVLQQNKMQAVTFLYGIERDLIETEANDPKVLNQILQKAATHRNGELEFSLFSLSLLNAEGDVVTKTSQSKEHQMVMGQTQGADFDSMAGHHVQLLQKENSPFAGGEVQYFHDDKTGQKITTMTVSIPVKNTDYILSANLDLKKTMAAIEQTDRVFEQTLFGSFAIGFLVLYGVIDFAIRKGLVNPIRKISTVTSDISHGNFSARIGDLCCPELQHLGTSVDRMAENIEQLISEQETAYLQSLKSLMKALEAKDPYTAQHSARVAKFSVLLGKQIGLPPKELKLLEKGALMHDLGKIGVPDNVLNKPSALDDAEFQQVKSHPVTTAKIMKPLSRFKEFAQIAAWHHERWDGKGYPDGLQGEEIPILARIVCIADTWDAMTGDRIYRKGMSQEKAISIMENEKDSGQWDPYLLQEFISLIKETNQPSIEMETRQSA